MVNTSVCRTDTRRFESDPCLSKSKNFWDTTKYTGVRFPSALQNMANKEVYIRPMEWLKKVNKITLVGALGVAAVAAVTPGLHALVVPALIAAGIDVSQIIITNKVNRKRTQTA